MAYTLVTPTITTRDGFHNDNTNIQMAFTMIITRDVLNNDTDGFHNDNN